MFNRMIGKTLLATALGLMGMGSLSTARADASCNSLIGNIQGTLAACGGGSACVAKVQQVTNFFQIISDINHVQLAEYATFTLANASFSLFGRGNALFSNRFVDAAHQQPFDFKQPTSVTFELVVSGPNAGLVTLNFGPLINPVCFGNKFMVVPSANSVDVFSFDLPNLF
jgi:hypothetical protein